MSFEALLGPISVVVEKLLVSLEVAGGHQDEARPFPEHDHLGAHVGRQPGVVDQSAETDGLFGGVDAVKRKCLPLKGFCSN